jgi:phosphoesterase RecJ-like protein
MTATRGSAGRRQQRVGESLRAELSRLLTSSAADPSLAWCTITDVQMSPDLKHARVFFVPSNDTAPADMGRSLERAAAFLQREIGANLRLRFTPKLTFRHDESFDTSERIDALIAASNAESERRAAAENGEQRLARLVADAERILVATHANPDGDAIGSLLGFDGILRLLGRQPITYCPDGVPPTLGFLPGIEHVRRQLEPESAFELTVLLDTADASLLPAGFPPEERRGTLVVIDHHAKHGALGDVVIRRHVAAVGELIFRLSQELMWPLDARIAQCLYTSIVADTGSFRYSSTTPDTHRAAGDLLALGADSWVVATALYESFPAVRQRLLAEVLHTLEVSADGRYASLSSTPEMLATTGATKADLDGMINYGRAIGGVEISAMFRQEPGGDVKVSFRSKGRVDVAELAARFGGGGHVNAAGCTIPGATIADAQALIGPAAAELLAAGDRNGSSD